MPTPTEQLLEGVDWTLGPDADQPGGDMPHATHSGVLEFAGVSLRCYRLSDGRTVFHADDVHRFFGDMLPESAGTS